MALILSGEASEDVDGTPDPFVLNDKVVLESCRLKPSIRLFVEMRELGLWAFVHVEDERLARRYWSKASIPYRALAMSMRNGG
jgi:hypothetical protein